MEMHAVYCVHGLEDLVKISILKSLYRYNEIHMRIPAGFLYSHRLYNSKFILKRKKLELYISFEKDITQFELLYNYSNQNCCW